MAATATTRSFRNTSVGNRTPLSAPGWKRPIDGFTISIWLANEASLGEFEEVISAHERGHASFPRPLSTPLRRGNIPCLGHGEFQNETHTAISRCRPIRLRAALHGAERRPIRAAGRPVFIPDAP